MAHAQELSKKGIRVIQLGGEVKGATEAVVGNQAILMLQAYHFTKGFFGVNGITAKNGMMTPDDNEAAIKRVAALHCREMFVLADASKFGQISSVCFAEYDDAMILTEGPVEGYESYDPRIWLFLRA